MASKGKRLLKTQEGERRSHDTHLEKGGYYGYSRDWKRLFEQVTEYTSVKGHSVQTFKNVPFFFLN